MMSKHFAAILFIFLILPATFSFAQNIYWDNFETVVPVNGEFHKVAYGGGRSVLVWQEFEEQGDGGVTYLSIASSVDGKEWIRHEQFAGPFSYYGNQVSLCSLAVRDDGTIFVAAAVDKNTIKLFSSTDNGLSFSESVIESDFEMTIEPKVFVKEDGSLIVFITKEAGSNLSIFYSLSNDGKQWSNFVPLVKELGLELNFLPFFVSKDGIEYVIFQAFLVQSRSTYQLYLKKSRNGGISWSNAKRITDFNQEVDGLVQSADTFDNQRPHFAVKDNKIFLTWERRNVLELNPQIYYGELELDGSVQNQQLPEIVSSGSRICNYPILSFYKDKEYITWFDNRAGDYHVIISSFNGILWQDKDLSQIKGNSIFGQPVETADSFHIFWENKVNDNSRILMLSFDTSVESPVIDPVNFTDGKPYSGDKFSFQWNVPEDPSGIAGFSYSFGRSSKGSPSLQIMNTVKQTSGTVNIEEDGQWYIYLAAMDYAGNWSKPTSFPVYSDTTPPPKVVFNALEHDKNGFLKSNTETISWKNGKSDEPIEDYLYNLQFLDSSFSKDINVENYASKIKALDSEKNISNSDYSFENIDNGVWALSVAPVDEAGNIGEYASAIFKLNKYIPVTYITKLDVEKDKVERVNIDITGRGFSVDGNIDTILIDKDGKAPWDYSFYLSDKSYTVENDRVITDFSVTDIAEGEYKIGLIHPQRGIYFSKPAIRFEPSGVVKFGYFGGERDTIWKPARNRFFVFDVGITLILLCTLMIVFSAIRLKKVYVEGKLLEKDIDAILRGVAILPSPIGKRERINVMKKRGISLRYKFTVFVIVIVLAVVMMVALPLGKFMYETQKKNLVISLKQQAEVLLESLASGARSYLPASNTLELGLLPTQKTAMEAAAFVTIIGKSSAGESDYNYVWASDDINIYTKINAQELIPGVSSISDSLIFIDSELEENINSATEERIGDIVKEVEALGQEARSLIGIRGSEDTIRELQDQIREYDQEIQTVLLDVGNIVRIYPYFDLENYNIEDTVYTFTKPIVYRQPGDDAYYRGLVMLGVSTSLILNEIHNSNAIMIRQTAAIAVVAVIFGIIAALLSSAIIIRPIMQLIKAIEVIRDTDDKEELKDYIIELKTKDELSLLADAVNMMTQGLVKAAAANKDLTVGKEVQKMFIPLEKDARGKKLTTGKEVTDHFEFFGYYEGAKGVSGDYFDYTKLDDNNYAIIKCDVAGKGVPASLIMVEVATIFLNYFRKWKRGQTINLPDFIITINDMLEERGFQGRFAALIVVVVNIKTGDCYLCNAGDNIVHLYKSCENRVKQITLPEAPASGVFPSSMIADKFRQIKMKLERGDALLLFTDGVEEGKRMFRDIDFNLITCAEPGLKDGDLHGNHYVSAGDEEFGISRIYDILNALFAKSTYTLEKYHNPFPEEEITFDFSLCEGTIEEAIMAMVSVERIFRIYLDSTANKDNKVIVDAKIDSFLKKYFDQYRKYFSNPVEVKDNPEYAVFSHLKQDDQYDDLTILAFRRK